MASVFKRGGKSNRGGWYYFSYVDHKGRRITKSAKTTDKAAAERIAAKHESDAALRREGVIDPHLDGIAHEGRRTVEDHLADFESKMRTAQRSDVHIVRTKYYVRTIAEACDFKLASEISADKVSRLAAKMLDEGAAARTVQAHLTAIKGFTKFLAERHKLPRDPLSSVKKPTPTSDRRRERRMLLPAEWERVRLALTEDDAPDQFDISPRDRLLLYATALETGLRSNELRSLTRGFLHLDAKPPYVVCQAGSAKNRHEARQFVTPALAAELRKLITTKLPAAPVFAMPAPTDVAAMLREDLAAARSAWLDEVRRDPQARAEREQCDFLSVTNERGEVLDFHALRHTCGAWAAMNGAMPNEVKALMRHSTITLTMDSYGHLFPGREAETVHRLPPVLGSETAVLAATGTDDMRVDAKAQRCAQRAVRETAHGDCEAVRAHGDDRDLAEGPETPANMEKNANACEAVRASAESRAAGIRTQNQGIMSQSDSLGLPEKTSTFRRSAAPRAAAGAETGDSLLDEMADGWPTLPPHARRCILAIVDAGDSLTEEQALEIVRLLGASR